MWWFTQLTITGELLTIFPGLPNNNTHKQVVINNIRNTS